MGHPRIPHAPLGVDDVSTPVSGPFHPAPVVVVIGRRIVPSIHGPVQLDLPVAVVIGLEVVNPTQDQILPPFPPYVAQREVRDVPRAHGYDVQSQQVGEGFLRPEYRREDVELLNYRAVGDGRCRDDVHVVNDVRDRRSAVIGELGIARRMTLARRDVEW